MPDVPFLRMDRLVSLAASRWSGQQKKLHRLRIPILMYHSISHELDTRRAPYYRTVTSPRTFARQMRWLAREGYQVISLADAGRRLGTAAGADAERLVAISFDDGFRDFFTEAHPVLSDLGFPSTVFLATDYLDRQFPTGRDCLRTREVARLAAGGVAFGSHTVTHPKLRELTRPQLARELAESKEAIEHMTGTPVTLFSTPYAFPEDDTAFVHTLANSLQSFGYTHGVTTCIGRASASDGPLFLSRLPVNELDDDKLFAAKLTGGYDWLRPGQRLFKQLKRQLRHVT